MNDFPRSDAAAYLAAIVESSDDAILSKDRPAELIATIGSFADLIDAQRRKR